MTKKICPKCKLERKSRFFSFNSPNCYSCRAAFIEQYKERLTIANRKAKKIYG